MAMMSPIISLVESKFHRIRDDYVDWRSKGGHVVYRAPPFNNTAFQASFAGAFMGFAKSLDPNVHTVPQVITPKWNLFASGHTEMLFNKTDANQPNIHSITTDPALLKRCQ